MCLHVSSHCLSEALLTARFAATKDLAVGPRKVLDVPGRLPSAEQRQRPPGLLPETCLDSFLGWPGPEKPPVMVLSCSSQNARSRTVGRVTKACDTGHGTCSWMRVAVESAPSCIAAQGTP